MKSVNQSNVDFTKRECEICLMLMKGIREKDMHKHSKMKYYTIRSHLKDIFQKTHTSCCLQLALWLVQQGWEITMEME